MSAPVTLLSMLGASSEPASLGNACLIIIDAQEEYRSGALPLVGIEPAITELARTIALARENNVPIFHVLHRVSEDSPIFNSRTPEYLEISEVAPQDAEVTVIKTAPNSFAGTGLAELIRQTGRAEIIVAGFMTHMCVSSTVRAALDLGLKSTVVAGACATRDLLGLDGRTVAAAEVHQAALAALADAFAVVVPDVRAWN